MNIRACSLALAASVSAISGATVFNLNAQYSPVSNPAGPWMYRSGATPLTPTVGWPGDPWGVPQDGWVGNFTPFFFKSNGTELFGHDWAANTLVVHTSNPGTAPFNVIWTAPTAGTADLSGFAWEGRDIGRANLWEVLKNGTALTSGIVASGDPFSSALPFDFSLGAGGPGALQNVAVAAGDLLEVRFTEIVGVGDYVAFDFTVDFTPTVVPEPASIAFLSLGAIGLLRRRK